MTSSPPANIANPGAKLGAVLRVVSPKLARYATHLEPARARSQLFAVFTTLASLGLVVPARMSHTVELIVVGAAYVLPTICGELIRLGVFAPAAVAAAVDRSAPAPEGYTGLVVAGPAVDEGLAPPKVEAALEALPAADDVEPPTDARPPQAIDHAEHDAARLAAAIADLPRRSIDGRRWVPAGPLDKLIGRYRDFAD